MDIWVAAARHLGNRWQKLLKENDGLPDSYSRDSDRQSDSFPLGEQRRDKKRPISRLNRIRLGDEGMSSSDCTFVEDGLVDGPGSAEMASTSGGGFDDGISVSYGNSMDWNVLSLASLPPEFSGMRNNLENGERIKGISEVGAKCSGRNKSFGRRSAKPLSSLDSCLAAQLYKEHVQMEDYLFSPFPSPSRTTSRQLLVTDGSRIISRHGSDSLREQFETGESELYQEDGLGPHVKDVVLGVPPLPEISNLELPKKSKEKKGKGWQRRSGSTRFSTKQLQSQDLPDGIFLFSLGISLGVMSTIVANKREVDKLNKLLKQTENFVQDLQEELEMKDSLTVKEIDNEGCGSQQTSGHVFPNQDPTSFSFSTEMNNSFTYDSKRPDLHKSGDNLESMSKIEAELEAELEMLEMNMKASSLERRLSGLVEVDPDFVADIVQGELRADMVNGGGGGLAYSKSDGTGTSTTQTPNVNYAVSPRELSLRLHEVIQSRLEERIVELETALENSQKRTQNTEARQMNTRRNYFNIDIGSSSQESPIMIEESNGANEAFFLNLSGDALDAYNEACDEFTKNSVTAEKGQPLYEANKSDQIMKELSSDTTPLQSQNGDEENGFLPHLNVDYMDSRELVYNKVKTWKERNSILGLDEVVETEDDDDEDDEFGRLLIKEIVEKARQGSPVVLNAKRMLYSLEEEP